MSELPNTEFPSNMPPAQPQRSSGLNTTSIILLVLGGCLALACLVPVCIIMILALLGPSIGNVFSEIIQTLEVTPTPSMLGLR